MMAAMIVKGGKSLGMGHLTRARQLLRIPGIELAFFAASDETVEAGKELGLEIIHSDHPETLNTIISEGIRLLILDCHGLPEHVLSPFANKLMTVSFDDTGSGADLCDILIDAQKEPGDDPMHLFGPEYAIIRDDVMDADRGVPTFPPQRFLISAGGSDDGANLCREIGLFLSSQFPHLLFDCLVPGNVLQDAGPNLKIHPFGEHFPQLLSDCDVFITAAGISMYESAFLGTPFIAFPLLDHQRDNIENFREAGAIFMIWDDPDDFESLASLVRDLPDDQAVRNMCSNNMMCVDGQGFDRITEAILELYQRI